MSLSRGARVWCVVQGRWHVQRHGDGRCALCRQCKAEAPVEASVGGKVMYRHDTFNRDVDTCHCKNMTFASVAKQPSYCSYSMAYLSVHARDDELAELQEEIDQLSKKNTETQKKLEEQMSFKVSIWFQKLVDGATGAYTPLVLVIQTPHFLMYVGSAGCLFVYVGRDQCTHYHMSI